MKHKNYFLIGIYLVSIVIANLMVYYFGPAVTIICAFLFIGLDLTTRDILHESWHRKNLWLKMLVLIFAGSLISYLINSNTLRIAIASFLAFFFSGIVDFVTYSVLYKKEWWMKINGSNLFSSLTDSIIFPTFAFGVFMPLIILGQFLAKVLGGLIWSFALIKLIKKNRNK